MEYMKFRDICDILNGYAFKSEKYVSDGIRVIRITNVQKGKIIDDNPVFYSEEYKELINKQLLYEGDLLISLTGNVGRVGLLKRDMLPAALNQRVGCLRLKSRKINIKYLYHFLNSNKFECDCIMNSKGVAQKNMSTEWIKEYSIPVPSMQTQLKIVKILDTVQDIINKREKQIHSMDELIKARFIEIVGDPVANPKGWSKDSIGSVVKSITAGWSTNGEVREKKNHEKAVLKVSAVTKGYFKPDEYKVVDNNVAIKKYIYPQKGDLLFSRANTREMVGATCVIERDYPDLLLPDKLWKVLFEDCVNVYYMKYIMSEPSIRAEFSAQSTGTSGSMYNVSMDKFKNVIIPIPPIGLQNEFKSFVQQVEKQKFILQQSLNELEKQFQALMQEAFKVELFPK